MFRLLRWEVDMQQSYIVEIGARFDNEGAFDKFLHDNVVVPSQNQIHPLHLRWKLPIGCVLHVGEGDDYITVE